MAERDPFWDRQSDIEREKQPYSWPRAVQEVGTTLIVCATIVALVYVVVRYG